MKAMLAVMTREVMTRRELFLLAVAVAVVVSLLPFLPNIENYEATDVRTVGSSASALALGCVLALVLGATIFGSELSEGRLGFFFSRPVSGFAVWWGKVSAAMALIWIVEIIVLVPALYHERLAIFTSSDPSDWLTILGYVIAPLLLFLFAHSVSIMARARTPWLILDMGGAIVIAIFAWLNLKPLFEIGAPIALLVIAGCLIAALLVALSIGGASGVVVGRVDLKRTHGALSLALWGTLAICVAAITAYGGWLRDFGPRVFDDIKVMSVSPDGQWVEVLGYAPHRLDVKRRCLVSTVDHRWIHLPVFALTYWRPAVYSHDGSTIVWLGEGLSDEPRALWLADLGRPDPMARSSNLVVSPEAVLTLSPDGSHLAVLEEGLLSIYGISDERLLTATRLPEELHRAGVLFDAPESLRVFARSGEQGGHSLIIAEMNAVTGKVYRTGKIDDLAKESSFVVDSGLNHLVMWTWSEDLGAQICKAFDAKTGALINGLSGAGFRSFLADGRMVVLQIGGDGRTRLVVETIWFDDRKVHDLGRAEDWRLSGEVLPGVVVVSRLEDTSDRTRGLHIDLVDVDSGEVRSLGNNIRRTLMWFRGLDGHTRGIFWYGNQPAASRLFLDQTGALVRWDPESGEMVHVVGGRQ